MQSYVSRPINTTQEAPSRRFKRHAFTGRRDHLDRLRTIVRVESLDCHGSPGVITSRENRRTNLPKEQSPCAAVFFVLEGRPPGLTLTSFARTIGSPRPPGAGASLTLILDLLAPIGDIFIMSNVDSILQKLNRLDAEETRRVAEAVREHLEELEDIAAYDKAKAKDEPAESLDTVLARYSKPKKS